MRVKYQRENPDSTIRYAPSRNVYVVVRVNSTTGPFAPVNDGYVVDQWVYECGCGALADTRGHFTSYRAALRHARALNRGLEEEQSR